MPLKQVLITQVIEESQVSQYQSSKWSINMSMCRQSWVLLEAIRCVVSGNSLFQRTTFIIYTILTEMLLAIY